MLLAADLYEYFINVESIAVASVLPLQPARIVGTELDAPQAYRFTGDGDTSFCQEVFDVSMAKVKAVIQPKSLPRFTGAA